MFYGIEVLWNYVLLVYGEGKMLLEEDNQIDRAGRINDSAKKRIIIPQGFAATKEKVIYEKAPNFTLDVCCVHFVDRTPPRFVKCVART